MKIANIIFIITLLLIMQLTACNNNANNRKADESQETINYTSQMNEQEYWNIINTSAQAANGNEEVQANIIRNELAKRSAEDILEYMKIQAKLMNESNCYNVLYAYAIYSGMPLLNDETSEFYVSDDGFIYFCLWLLHQPEEIYKNTLENGDYLASVLSVNVIPEYELIAGTAIELYFEKSGVYELPESYVTEMHGDDVVKGTRYSVKDLPLKYPKLWAKFMNK